MDFDTSTLFAGLILGLVGTGLFMYGKRLLDPRCMVGGVLIGAVPMFVHPAWAVWLTGLGATAVLLAWLNADRLIAWANRLLGR
jgi:hypothetical protein